MKTIISVDFSKRDDKDRLCLPLSYEVLCGQRVWLTDEDIIVRAKIRKYLDTNIYAEINWATVNYDVTKWRHNENQDQS